MSQRHLALREKPHVRTQVTYPAQVRQHQPHLRWVCSHHAGVSDIEAFVPETGGLEIIAATRMLPGVDARATAELIVDAVNAYQTTRPLIAELLGALKLCLQSNGLSWEAQREAEIVVRKVGRKSY